MRNRKNGGFTLAELLAAVAILIILFGLIATNVQAHRRSQTRLEFDSIAKEIFIAAQNHLSAAEGQNYLGLEETEDNFGTLVVETRDDETKVSFRYFDNAEGRAILGQMLPTYALDETVRSGGSYIIRYQAHPARVLDVFYSKEGKSGLLGASGRTLVAASDYAGLMQDCRGDDKTKNRENYDGYVVGWYGGDDELQQGEHLGVPTIEIVNEEQLYVKVTDPNKNAKAQDGNDLPYTLMLVVKGKTSTAEKYFKLWENGLPGDDDRVANVTTDDEQNRYFSVLLDDVTVDGLHFAELAPSEGSPAAAFKPGEDLEIYAVAFSTKVLANVATSPAQTTNSLFADPAEYTEGAEVRGTDVDMGVAGVAWFRHLENLEEEISKRSNTDSAITPVSIAGQMSDLDWDAPWTDWKGEETSWADKKIASASGTPLTGEGFFYPVSPDAAINYHGKTGELAAAGEENKPFGHIVMGVRIDHSGAAGLFGEIKASSSVDNLELIDFDVKGTTFAGALIGKSGNASVSNVLAHNTLPDDGSREIKAETGDAGGLIGKIEGGEVTYSAAALYVNGGGSAGGLIGAAPGVSVVNSYSGGHTYEGWYKDHSEDGVTVRGTSNVTGATVGGLIGTWSGSNTIQVINCYSTCSASGTTAGGLIGSASAGKVSNCYATGLVSCSEHGTAGAFIGAGSPTDGGDNRYLWIINQDQQWHKDILEQNKENPDTGKELIPGPIAAEDVTANTAKYKEFLQGADPAKPYDEILKTSYEGKYPMLSIKELGGTVTTNDYISAHYGDWPMPETLVVNE